MPTTRAGRVACRGPIRASTGGARAHCGRADTASTVFTGASSRAATILLRAAGIAVDVLVGGDEVTRPKPAADGLLLTARRLGVAPGDLAYIGDAPIDLRAATAAGGIGAAAAWGHQYERAEPADITLATPAEALALLFSSDR